jgi:phosphopantetheinyl transferase (holo-ACP synthase)
MTMTRTYVICGSPRGTNREFCPRCQKLTRQYPAIAKRWALVAALDKSINRFRCYYTNIVLEENDNSSPFFINFDHPIPGDDTRLVACAKFVNELKNAMTESEFRTNIPLLAGHFENGTVIDRSNFKIANFHPHPKRTSIPPNLIPPEPPVPRWFSETCRICGKPPSKGSYYCKRCQKLLRDQVETAAKEAASKAAYDKEHDCFRCFYTDMIVDLDDPSSPFHLSFDHRFPGRPGNILVCILIINEMKSQLSDAEFITIVKQLAKHFTTKEPFDLGGVKFEYWS